MEYMTTAEAAELWGIKVRRVQALCVEKLTVPRDSDICG